jgi:predicted site-specific integrase-resolvase
MGPVEVGRILGVKPQVVVNWIREGRAHPSAVDAIGRNRFTAEDVAHLRAGLGKRRSRSTGAGSLRSEPEEGGDASQGG